MRLEHFFQDVRYAVRTFGRVPLFTATVVATMGLALGLVGSAFTLLNAYLIRPVNLPNPRAVYAQSWDTEQTYYERFGLVDYEVLEAEARGIAGLAATMDVVVNRGAGTTRALLVTGNYFETIGARPAIGRLLRRDDTAARGAGPVVVLSYEMWRSQHGSDPAIVGRQIELGRQRFEVVGVTPPSEATPVAVRVESLATRLPFDGEAAMMVARRDSTPSDRRSTSPRHGRDARTRDCRVAACESSASPKTWPVARSPTVSMPAAYTC